MTAPIATYRLQFRNGMTFDRAAELLPYFARLGVSDLYASPLFAATPGSTHGYDGISFSAMDPEMGGEDGFDRLCAALKDSKLGLLLDFVPNHMAAAEENPWWRSVLEWGAQSPYAQVFDVDWSAPKVNLPILGATYGHVVRDGIFGVAFDPAAGRFDFTCYERRLPIRPTTYECVLGRVDDRKISHFGQQFADASVAEAEELKKRLAVIAENPTVAAEIGAATKSIANDPDGIHALHESQVWRLTHWRLGRETMSYRRFFEISDLICLRVEDPEVFDAVHARLFKLIASGRISGVRVDHIDGLADPKAYLQRFQRAVDAKPAFYLVVEKILEGEERLRPDWPVAGTTGYEFISALAGLLVDPRGESAMTAAYEAFAGPSPSYEAAARAAKKEVFSYNLAAELEALTARAQTLAAVNEETRNLPDEALRNAILELAAVLPVYRTYVAGSRADEADRSLIERAAADASRDCDANVARAISFLADRLTLDMPRSPARDAALDFAIRFQQTTGPVMAKAVEDTLFYRYNRLIGLNEVGGSPDSFGAPCEAFHNSMLERMSEQPLGLTATSTHDTKRGEDARARLYVLSEMPETWRQAVSRWAKMNACHRTELSDGAAPDRATEWLFYQALAGAWPAKITHEDLLRDESPELDRLRDRMLAYMEKAVREAKARTSWIDPDARYEAAVSDFVGAALSYGESTAFLLDFAQTCRPVWLAGAVNGLSQVAVKVMAPGVPDFYQGTETWDFSLVDPDNRRAVDHALRRDMLRAVVDMNAAALLDQWASGAPKMALTAAGLRARNERPALFSNGDYIPLSTEGDRGNRIVAFARKLDRATAILIAPRFVLDLVAGVERPLVPRERWGDTTVLLPEVISGRTVRHVVTGETYETRERISAADALARFPVAILVDPA